MSVQTGPSGAFATALVSFGKSGRYQNRPVSVEAKSQFTLVCLKSFMATLYLKKWEKMTGSIIGQAEKRK